MYSPWIKNRVTDAWHIGAGPTGIIHFFQCGMQVWHAIFWPLTRSAAMQPFILKTDIRYSRRDQPFWPKIWLANPWSPNCPLLPHLPSWPSKSSGWTAKKAGAFTSKQAKIWPNRSFGLLLRRNRIILARPADNLAQYEGQSVFYAVRNRAQFNGKKLSSQAAEIVVDWAISLSEIAAYKFIHRRDKFRASSASLKNSMIWNASGQIKIITPAQLDSLERMVFAAPQQSQTWTATNNPLKPTSVYAFFGLAADLGPITEWD